MNKHSFQLRFLLCKWFLGSYCASGFRKEQTTTFLTPLALVSFVYSRSTKRHSRGSSNKHGWSIISRFGSNWPSGFREEDSKQTTPILTQLGLMFLLYNSDQPTKHNILEDLSTNIYTKFVSNSTIGFRKEDEKQTTPFWHIEALVSLVYFQSTKTNFSSNIHSYQVWFQLGLWLQKRRLKTYNTLLGTLGLLFLLCTSSDVVMETTKYSYTELKWSTNV